MPRLKGTSFIKKLPLQTTKGRKVQGVSVMDNPQAWRKDEKRSNKSLLGMQKQGGRVGGDSPFGKRGDQKGILSAKHGEEKEKMYQRGNERMEPMTPGEGWENREGEETSPGKGMDQGAESEELQN